MNRRFSDRNKNTMRGIDALTPTSESFLNQDIIAEFAREYSSMVTVDFLPAEINNFRQMLKRRKELESANWQGYETLLELQGYVHRLRDAFTETDKLGRTNWSQLLVHFAHFYSFLRTKF